MRHSFTASQAAARLGISAKALRVYERAGLIAPGRTAAGWRVYGPAEMARAGEVAALRAVGLGLGQIAPLLDGDFDAGLAARKASLRGESQRLAEALDRLRRMRAAPTGLSVAFDLPWPWGGERFELTDIPPITYIVGPLGSGKTRLAIRLAEALPGGRFVPMERQEPIDALIAEADGPVVVDMVEQGLDSGEQAALIARLRAMAKPERPLFLMTRSSSILDLDAVEDEAIILCPANHSPPVRVAPWPGAPGYEAVATCLATPEVRARTAGLVACSLSQGREASEAKV